MKPYEGQAQAAPPCTDAGSWHAASWAEKIFGGLFALLVLSFYFFPDQAGRNLILYATALSAHAFLGNAGSWKHAYGRPAGWAVLVLALPPLLSLTWSSGAGPEALKRLGVAAYCLLLVYLGAVRLLPRWPHLSRQLADLMLMAGNVAGLAAIVSWLIHGSSPGVVRLEGVLGLDNPVHGSILLLASTLVVLWQIVRGRRGLVWLGAMIVPLTYVMLAGSRMAMAAYLVVAVAMVVSRGPRAATAAIGGILGIALITVGLVGVDTAAEIWLARGISFRDVVWEQVWLAYRECNPLIGCGIGTPLDLNFGGVVSRRAHSIFLAALYHQGLLGLAVFAGALGWLVYRGFRYEGSVQGWAWALSFVLLANLTSGHHVLVRASLFWPCFWIPVMIVAASGRGSSRANVT